MNINEATIIIPLEIRGGVDRSSFKEGKPENDIAENIWNSVGVKPKVIEYEDRVEIMFSPSAYEKLKEEYGNKLKANITNEVNAIYKYQSGPKNLWPVVPKLAKTKINEANKADIEFDDADELYKFLVNNKVSKSKANEFSDYIEQNWSFPLPLGDLDEELERFRIKLYESVKESIFDYKLSVSNLDRDDLKEILSFLQDNDVEYDFDGSEETLDILDATVLDRSQQKELAEMLKGAKPIKESESLSWFKLKELVKESKIQVKRKYTDMHPSLHVNSNAKVRNEIINYLGTNHMMTEDEFDSLLTQKTRHSDLWKQRNSDIYEKDSKGYIKLTEKGQRILKGLSVQVNESKIGDVLIDITEVLEKNDIDDLTLVSKKIAKILNTKDIDIIAGIIEQNKDVAEDNNDLANTILTKFSDPKRKNESVKESKKYGR